VSCASSEFSLNVSKAGLRRLSENQITGMMPREDRNRVFEREAYTLRSKDLTK
jgi:hypothetical protein